MTAIVAVKIVPVSVNIVAIAAVVEAAVHIRVYVRNLIIFTP